MPVFGKIFRDLSTPWRWILGIPGIIILLGIIIQLLLSLYLDRVIGNRLQERVHSATEGEYRLYYEDLDLSLLGRRVELKDLHLFPDTTEGQSDDLSTSYPIKGKFRLEMLRVGDISIWNYLLNNELAIGSILLDKPRLSVDLLRSIPKRGRQSFSSVDSSLFALISGRFTALELDEFEIQNGSFSVNNQEGGQPIATLGNLNLQLQNIRIDSSSASSNRLFITDDIELDAEAYTMSLMQGLYTFELPRLRLSSASRRIEADSLRLIPQLPRYEFAEDYGKQIDRIDLLIPRTEFDRIDFTELTNDGRFYARVLTIADAQLSVFHDMNVPVDSTRTPQLPQIAFKNLGMPVKIKKIRIADSNISYTEHQKDVPEPGTITFNQFQATIDSLSNYSRDLKKGHQTTVETHSLVMGEGLLDVYFTFQMDSPQGRHSIYGKMDTVAFSQFNPALENLAFIHIDQGTINSLEFTMNLNKEKARGTVTLAYEDLSIEMLQSETLEQGTGQEIKSFIANTFVVEENNNEVPLRKGEISFERDKQKSVFNFWWKSLSTGLENSIGL